MGSCSPEPALSTGPSSLQNRIAVSVFLSAEQQPELRPDSQVCVSQSSGFESELLAGISCKLTIQKRIRHPWPVRGTQAVESRQGLMQAGAQDCQKAQRCQRTHAKLARPSPGVECEKRRCGWPSPQACLAKLQPEAPGDLSSECPVSLLQDL